MSPALLAPSATPPAASSSPCSARPGCSSVGIVAPGYAEGFLNVVGATAPQGVFLAQFGAANVVPDFVGDLSPERADLLAPADVLVTLTYDDTLADPLTYPTLAALPAVTAGRVVRVDVDRSQSLYQSNPLSLPTAVEIAALAAAAAR